MRDAVENKEIYKRWGKQKGYKYVIEAKEGGQRKESVVELRRWWA